MRRPVVLLLATLTLAGCFGSEEPATPAAATPPPAADAPVEAVAAAPPAAPPPNATELLVATPIAWEGELSATACLPSPTTGGCSQPAADAPDDDLYPIDVPGAPRRVTASLAWTASSPLTAELRFELVRLAPCGDGCMAGEAIGEASGESPLALDVEIPPLEPGEILRLQVGAPGRSAATAYAIVHTQQTFTVEGEVTYVTTA